MNYKYAFGLASLLLSGSSLSAQWNPDPSINTPICTVTGKQIDLRMETDGKGGAFIVWKDYRASVPDIYIQRVNAAGVPQWAADGVVVCNDPYDQSTPGIIDDMRGGVIVSWSDWRSGIERDLYAQRIDSNGVVKWTVNGAVVANKVEREHNQRMISDGAGGAIVVWEQQRTTDYTWDIWAQRLDSNGTMKWAPGGIPLVVNGANRINPRIQADGKGGAFIVFQDRRDGLTFDIYAQHLDANGNRLGGTLGTVICDAASSQVNPKIDPDSISKGFYVAWADDRTMSGDDIYAQRMDSALNRLWALNGIVVCNAGGIQGAVDVHSNESTDGVILTWKDSRAGQTDIYAQRMNPAGIAQWATNGVAVCNSSGPQVNPNIAGDGGNGVIIVWQDSTLGNWDVKVQRISGDGTALWTTNGEWVCNAIGEQTSPKNIPDGAGGSIFAWQDKRTGTNDIYAHHLFSDGNPILSKGEGVAENQLEAWPNPFTNEVHLRWDMGSSNPVTVSVMDVSGKVIHEVSSDAIQVSGGVASTVLHGEDVFPAAGMYFIHVNSGERSAFVKAVKL